ncbi:MAG TPA: efflux RND transporter periplasmic adaptor subunit [Vitreimonas sp.]|uniref:efflux RND transporter periplasmic adaptor subunit n=1 Tax=Vitreimonas sp. TaxID=3069702 RepID=UPI002D7383B2|nr:efflux RND transporter periplasmic adaptor subunit [Vitreimonas sp.]HYD89755.1 efflux RND transporter periplasmic adaptor subunit [Vitreimonas sp.]
MQRLTSLLQLGPKARLGAGAAVITAVGFAGFLAIQGASSQEAPPPPPTVTVARPLVESVSGWTEHSGRFVAAADVDVRPRVSGYLQRVHFREGQIVRQGDLLFTIDPAPFRAAVDRARADVAQAEAQRARAGSEFARAQTLLELDAISQEEFEARREAAAQALAGRLAAEAALRTAQLDYEYAHVRAPITGRISDAHVHAGNLVRAGEDVLTRIVSLDPIHFEFAVPESLLSEAAATPSGEPRRVLLQLEGEPEFLHEGRLDFVDNAVDPQTGTIRGRASFVNASGGFTPGQFGRVRIIAPDQTPSVLIPEVAVSADQSHRYVLVLNEENIVQYQPVELGQRVGDGLRVVRTGLDGDERVIINGLQRAFPGAPVTPQPGQVTLTAHARQG